MWIVIRIMIDSLLKKSDNFQYDEYPSAIHVAACIDQASKELDELLFGGGYGENGEGHASPIILY